MGNTFGIIFEFVGAVIFWALKGFHGNPLNEISHPEDVNYKSLRNAITSFVTIALLLYFISKF